MWAYFLTRQGLVLVSKKHTTFPTALRLQIPMLLIVIRNFPQTYQWAIQTIINRKALPQALFQNLQLLNSLLIQTLQIHCLPTDIFELYENFLRNYNTQTWLNLIRLVWQIMKINGVELTNFRINYRLLSRFYFRWSQAKIKKLHQILYHTINKQAKRPKIPPTNAEYYQLWGFLIAHLETYGGLQIKGGFWFTFQQFIAKLTD